MRELPITKFWYGKGARFRSIEELIDKDPDYFIWAVEKFQDITIEQANYFKQKYGMDLPNEVISPPGTIPYTHIYRKGQKEPDEEYMKLCNEYIKTKEKYLKGL